MNTTISRLFALAFAASAALTAARARAENADELAAQLKELRAKVEGLKQENAALQGRAAHAADDVDAAKKQALEAAKKQAADAVKQAKEQAAKEVSAARDEAKRHALDAINSIKYVNLTFGVVPNSDRKANNVANLGLNYAPEFNSEIRYLNRNLGQAATVESTTAASEDSLVPAMTRSAHATSTVDETNFEFTAVRYKPEALQIGGTGIQPAFRLGVDQLRNNSARFIVDRQSFADPKSGTIRNIIQTIQIEEHRVATMPNVGVDLHGSNQRGFSMDCGGAFLFANRESYSWQERGTGSMPPLSVDATSGQEIAAQTVDLHDNHVNQFASNGLKAHLDLAYETEDHGFVLRADYLTKKGTRQSYELDIASADPVIDSTTGKVTNDGEKTVKTVQSSVKETYVQGHGSLGWKMKFLGRYGIVPQLTLDGAIDRKIVAQGDTKQSTVAKQFALGVLVDY